MADIEDVELIQIPMTAEEARTIIQVILDAPYIGLSRPNQLTDALCAVTNGAIAAGQSVEDIKQSFSDHVWTDNGYESEKS